MKILPALIPTTAATQRTDKQTPQRADNPLNAPPGETVGAAAGVTSQGGDDKAAISKAAKQFESYFLNHMFKVMRETVPKDGLFKQSYSNDTYTSMLDQEYSKLLSDAGGFGLAAVLERQLSGRTSQNLDALEEMIDQSEVPETDPE